MDDPVPPLRWETADRQLPATLATSLPGGPRVFGSLFFLSSQAVSDGHYVDSRSSSHPSCRSGLTADARCSPLWLLNRLLGWCLVTPGMGSNDSWLNLLSYRTPDLDYRGYTLYAATASTPKPRFVSHCCFDISIVKSGRQAPDLYDFRHHEITNHASLSPPPPPSPLFSHPYSSSLPSDIIT